MWKNKNTAEQDIEWWLSLPEPVRAHIAEDLRFINDDNYSVDEDDVEMIDEIVSVIKSNTSFSLSAIGISEIPPSISYLNKITSLNLAHNNIQDLSPLTPFTKLKSLSLHDNNISDITPLSQLTHLTELMLGDNHITDISPIAHLKKLKELSLWNNPFTEVSSLGNLKKLTSIIFNDNDAVALESVIALKQKLPKCEIYFNKELIQG